MRFPFCLLLALSSSAQTTMLGPSKAVGPSSSGGVQQFMVLDGTGHWLVTTPSNHPVFMTADAPQLLVTQVNDADVDQYLADRQSRGYNAIWIIPFDNTYQSNTPQDFYGDVPFSGADFTNENAAYWAHVDHVLQRAAAYGITCIFNAGFVGLNSSSGYLDSFLATSNGTLTDFGTFLGNRYRNYPNIIWMVGGDMDPASGAILTKINILALAIAAADTNHLITSEACRVCSPINQSSMDAWSGPPSWLKLNWVYNQLANVQTGCASNYARSGALPAFMGEAWYELEHSMTALQLRNQAYWSVLSGCSLGITFGNEAIWTMGGPYNTSGQTWQSQLSSSGSVSESWLGKVMKSREFWLMVPDASNVTLTGGIGSGSTISVCARSSDGQTILIYDPIGTSQNPVVNMAKITSAGSLVRAWWFHPQTGATTDLGTFANSGSHTFTAPDGNDWVLVLDDNNAALAAPGTTIL